MKRQDVLEALCSLASRINCDVFDYKYASDCFCDLEKSAHYSFDEKIIDFIEQAVNEKIRKERP